MGRPDHFRPCSSSHAAAGQSSRSTRQASRQFCNVIPNEKGVCRLALIQSVRGVRMWRSRVVRGVGGGTVRMLQEEVLRFWGKTSWRIGGRRLRAPKSVVKQATDRSTALFSTPASCFLRFDHSSTSGFIHCRSAIASLNSRLVLRRMVVVVVGCIHESQWVETVHRTACLRP